MMNKGKVFLVGAGPGDPNLITVKGLECIRTADVVIYDRLASPRLLSSARPDAELIYVGKSPDRHTLKQEEINDLLVAKAMENKLVVRLKGGDPFVFGRGGEEAEALAAKGIPFEIVPGITSAIAVPAYAGIPVTHRNLTSTFAVITGHEDPTKNESNIAWDKISTGIGTLIFLMGMENLPYIVEKLISNGRSPDTPVALIRWGTRPEQRTLTGSLATIVELAEQHNFTSPAIIIVGEVVSLRDQLSWFEDKPLFGKRIVVTRSREQASAFAEKIESLGGEAWEFPTIAITDPDDFNPLDQVLEKIDKYDWIIFTSVNGVNSFFKRLRFHRRDLRELKGVRLCAIGPKTREALEAYGLIVDYLPEEYRAEAIIEGFAGEDLQGKRFLLPRADIARKILPETLRQMGAVVDEVTAYKTVREAADRDMLIELFQRKMIHVVTFTSSSTVKNFAGILAVSDLPGLLQDTTVACIGPITADTARSLGLKVDIEAKEYTIDGLIQAILLYFGKVG